jgi:peptide/nickel transport system substrate-binding protein
MLENGHIIVDGIAYGGIYSGFGEKPEYGGIAIVSHRRDLPGTDIMQTGGTISLKRVSGSLYGDGNIVQVNPLNVFEVQCWLCETYEMSEGGKVWTFNLHKNIKWHDGVAFTADDLVYWFDLSITPEMHVPGRTPSRQVSYFNNPVSYEAVDQYTFKVVLPKANPNWLEELGVTVNQIAHPKHLAQPLFDEGTFKLQPIDYGWVALGPFRFESYDKGSVVKVRRSENYFETDEWGQQLPYLDGINYVVMRDRGAMGSAFRAGRLHETSRGTGFHLLPVQEEAIMRELGDKTFIGRVLYLGWGLGPNNSKAPWSDIKLRQAVDLFTDRVEVLKLAYGGAPAAIPGVLWQPGSPWADNSLLNSPGWNPATKEEDRAAAMKILKDNGYEGMKANLLCRDVYLHLCEAMDGQFRAMGFDSVIEMTEITALNERTPNGDFDTVIFSSGAYSFPGQAVTAWISTNPYGGRHHNDLKVDEMLAALQETSDYAARVKLAQEFERYVIQEKFYGIPWGKEIANIAYNKCFKNVAIPQTYVHNNTSYATAWLDQDEC